MEINAGDFVTIKSLKDIREYERIHGPIYYGWNEQMDSLCSERFEVIGKCCIHGHTKYTLKGLHWSFSEEMFESVRHPIKPISEDTAEAMLGGVEVIKNSFSKEWIPNFVFPSFKIEGDITPAGRFSSTPQVILINKNKLIKI